jgi:hypothetical protein
MERSFRDDDAEPGGFGEHFEFGIVSRKDTLRLVGNAVWLVSGEGQPRVYRLEHWFIASGARPAEQRGFTAEATGTKGCIFRGGIELTGLPWFTGFLRVKSNFSTGLSPLSGEDVKLLEDLVRSRGFPAPEDAPVAPGPATPPAHEPGAAPTPPPTDPPPGVPEHVWQEIRSRQGQGAFRAGLLKAYGGKCCLTDCDAQEAVEAAPIEPHALNALQDVTNGLLLRADVHTLFDLGLLRIRPDTLDVVLAPSIASGCCASLAGRKVRLPTAPVMWPSPEKVRERWQRDQDRDTAPPAR